MKAFYILFVLVFLASCTGSSIEDTRPEPANTNVSVESELDSDEDEDEDEDEETVMDSEVQAEVVADIDAETEAIEEVVENQVVTLDAGYSNPKGPVDMMITYSIDSNDIIQSINVSATTYNLSDFNSQVQSLIGKNVSEAEDFYAAGSSLTSNGFTAAMKNR